MIRRILPPGSAPLRLSLIAAAIALCVWGSVTPAFAAVFDPEHIISNDNMRNSDAMTAAEIQAFLRTQTGPLKSLVTTDHTGTKRAASAIIWSACQAWAISPRVMLTMLQKEQSLLTRTTLAKNTLSRAIGAGCPGGPTNRYPGFGNQMWNGARMLDGYGEGRPGSKIAKYYLGITRTDIYRKPDVTLHPKNISTYKLYVYNPSIGASAPYGDLVGQSCTGNANFWRIYRLYFGGTFASPRMSPIYRFLNRTNGNYLYTTSLTQRYDLVRYHAKTWHFEGAAFSSDTSVAPTATVPMYRFYNKVTHRYSFVTSRSTYAARRTTAGRRTWSYGGIAFRVAAAPSAGALSVWRFQNRRTGGLLLTSSLATKNRLRTESYRKTWRYRGVAFYLPRIPKPSSVTTP